MPISFRPQDLKPLGRVEKIIKSRLLLVSMARKKPLPLGLEVYARSNDEFNYIGRLADIIGRTDRPYAVVKVEESVESSLLSSQLYYKLRERRRGSGSRRRVSRGR
ncbi:MAG: hypothetical protein QXS85_03275 [Acidilobaceae archaeon]